jgi:RimJ/RimL family protein N-acetyltransferase
MNPETALPRHVPHSTPAWGVNRRAVGGGEAAGAMLLPRGHSPGAPRPEPPVGQPQLFPRPVAAGQRASGMAAVTRLPSGRTLDLHRPRWQGVLDAEELAHCHAHGIELAYDCAQIGWVPATCVDDTTADDTTADDTTADDTTAAGNEPTVDLAAYATPEQDALRLLHTLSAQLERVTAGLPQAAVAAAVAPLRAALPPQIAACHQRHGVVVASRCHLLATARLAGADEVPATPATTAAEFTFRPWLPADAPRYRAMLDNPRLWHYLPESHPQPLTEAMALALIELTSIDARQQAVAVVRDGQPIGQCLLRLHEPFAGQRTAEVAYWLAEEHWGKGWMTRILPAFVAHCFAQFEVEVLEAWIRADHTASARVAQRSGFRRDAFAFEAELATTLGKPRAHRYVVYRGSSAVQRVRRAGSLPITPLA